MIDDINRLSGWIRTDVNTIHEEMETLKTSTYGNSILGYLEKKDHLLKISFDIQTLIAMILKIKQDLRNEFDESVLVSPYRVRILMEDMTEQLNYYSKILFSLSEQIKSIDVILNYRFNNTQKQGVEKCHKNF